MDRYWAPQLGIFSEEDDDSSGTVAEPHQEIGGVPVDMLVGL